MKKNSRSHKPTHHHHRKAQNHELIFALSLAVLVSMLGLYAYFQMYAYRVMAAPRP